jgi:hypothetical protein
VEQNRQEMEKINNKKRKKEKKKEREREQGQIMSLHVD